MARRAQKKMRKDYELEGSFLPNRKLSRQQAYAKLAANSEWRERHNAKICPRYPPCVAPCVISAKVRTRPTPYPDIPTCQAPLAEIEYFPLSRTP